ncbi:MAG: hypothetical protein ACI9J0_000453 [Cryomorphaceae bacterium]|jgi:hypothetical protein
MDRAEAYLLAQNELNATEGAGYGVASEHIDTIVLKDVVAASGITYEVELSYLWKRTEQDQILVICRVTSKNWFQHEQLERSITLCSPAI